MRNLITTFLLFACCSLPMTSSSAKASDSYLPQKVPGVPHLPNAYRLHAKVISGGQPDGEAGFRELRTLGIKTVISVDGAKPDVELAREFGLRYVHLPHGYDGIVDARVKELAKAVKDLPGPIYIHCHHGKHRSPAAATVACVSVGFLETANAIDVLETAGTSENYRGLYHAAQSARRIEDRLLDELQNDFPEAAALPPLAEAMVAMEHIRDRLTLIAKSDWKAPTDHPDLNAAHEALLMKEQFAELLRSSDVKQEPERFQQLLRETEVFAAELERVLSEPASARQVVRASQILDRLTRNCTTCHRELRDIPLVEKQ